MMPLAPEARRRGRPGRAHDHDRRQRPVKRRETWNRCDICGQFIPLSHFDDGTATRRLVSIDSQFTCEAYETLCCKHATTTTTGGEG